MGRHYCSAPAAPWPGRGVSGIPWLLPACGHLSGNHLPDAHRHHPPSDVATDNASVLTGPFETTSEDSVTPAKITGFALCFLALGCAGVGIGFLHQEAPLFGPTGFCCSAQRCWAFCPDLLCSPRRWAIPALAPGRLGGHRFSDPSVPPGTGRLDLGQMFPGLVHSVADGPEMVKKSWLWLGLLGSWCRFFALMGALLLWWDFWSLLPAAVLLLLGLVLLWPERPGLAAF